MRKNGKATSRSTLSKVLTLLRGKRALIALSVLFALVVVSLTLYVPILIGQAIDLIVGEGNTHLDGILQILVKVCAAVGLTAVFQWLSASRGVSSSGSNRPKIFAPSFTKGQPSFFGMPMGSMARSMISLGVV